MYVSIHSDLSLFFPFFPFLCSFLFFSLFSTLSTLCFLAGEAFFAFFDRYVVFVHFTFLNSLYGAVVVLYMLAIASYFSVVVVAVAIFCFVFHFFSTAVTFAYIQVKRPKDRLFMYVFLQLSSVVVLDYWPIHWWHVSFCGKLFVVFARVAGATWRMT